MIHLKIILSVQEPAIEVGSLVQWLIAEVDLLVQWLIAKVVPEF